jgi:hypothetical protein
MAPDPLADAAARLAATAVAQGFPARITDPSVLGRIAAVLADAPTKKIGPAARPGRSQEAGRVSGAA